MTTGTEVAVRRPQASTLPAKIQYARALADSGLLPTSYRQQPANVLWAMEFADMLHLPPMAAMTGVHVIEGKPTASAGLISALVRRAGHKLRVRGDAESATCEIVRADDPGYTFAVTFTMDDAERARLTGKPVWKQYGPSMLKARAITQCARDACEEALFGLHYTPEELGAEVDEDGVVTGVVVDEPAQQNGEDPWYVHPAPETDAAEEWIAAALRVIPDIGLEACRKLWTETREKVRCGELSDAGEARVLQPLQARMEALANPPQEAEVVPPAEPASPVAAGLDPDDPWALKVEEIPEGDDAAAAAVLDEATEMLVAGQLDAAHFGRIEDAISARFPVAGREAEAA
jgi:hypothetical protein